MGQDVILDIRNLDVEVENKKILRDLSIRLEKGKIYALMGPNGTGKSTLAYANWKRFNDYYNVSISKDS